MIIYGGIEWDYNNLEGIGYDSDTLLEPHATWLYKITSATNYEFETINLSDGEKYSSIYKRKESIIKIKDKAKRIVNRIHQENINLNETQSRKIGYVHKEILNFSDKRIAKYVNYGKEPTFYLLDEAVSRYKRPGEDEVIVPQVELSGSTCLFDFEANDNVWSSEDFDNWCESDSPINYNEIRPFIPGEYEYKNAYVGFRLTIPPTSGRYGVAHSTVYIDVEDTVEKGVATAIVGGLTEVKFTKRFYTSPHIMTSLNYSNEQCYIEVLEVSRDGFKFGLKSIITGNYLAGEINWLADGY